MLAMEMLRFKLNGSLRGEEAEGVGRAGCGRTQQPHRRSRKRDVGSGRARRRLRAAR